jgi:hypothetical protein
MGGWYHKEQCGRDLAENRNRRIQAGSWHFSIPRWVNFRSTADFQQPCPVLVPPHPAGQIEREYCQEQ